MDERKSEPEKLLFTSIAKPQRQGTLNSLEKGRRRETTDTIKLENLPGHSIALYHGCSSVSNIRCGLLLLLVVFVAVLVLIFVFLVFILPVVDNRSTRLMYKGNVNLPFRRPTIS